MITNMIEADIMRILKEFNYNIEDICAELENERSKTDELETDLDSAQGTIEELEAKVESLNGELDSALSNKE